MLFALLACTGPGLGVRSPPDASGTADTAIVAPAGDTETTADTAVPTVPDDGPCPTGMVRIARFCIDAWEARLDGLSPYDVPTAGVAVSEPGTVPQGYVSGDVAARACESAGRRLCTRAEWERACAGPDGRTYPYGDTHVPGACNEGRATHPVVELFGADVDWSSAQLNDPRLNQLPDSLAPTGAFADCVTPEGVFDLHGNLHEWVADADGTFKGGFYVDATLNGPGCTYTTTAHGTDWHDYSTGFRCCADVR